LKQRLQGSDNRPVSVINAGLQGVSLSGLTAAYEHIWAKWRPDVVCMVASGNRIALASDERIDPKLRPAGGTPAYGASPYTPTVLDRVKESAGAMASRLCLPTWLSINSQRGLYFMGVLDNNIDNPSEPFGALLAHGWIQGGLSPTLPHEAWDDFGTDLNQLKIAVRAHRARLIVAMAPSRFELSGSWWDNQKDVPLARLTIDSAGTMASICNQLDVTNVDLLTALKQGRQRIAETTGHVPPLYILFDYTHLDRDGNGIVAGEMARTIDNGALSR
jgi:hypothetical protein